MSYKCQECGRKFKTTKAAERASKNGCPKCGGVDIDLDVSTREQRIREIQLIDGQRAE